LSDIDIVRKLFDERISPIGLKDNKEKAVGWCKPHAGDADFTLSDCTIDGMHSIIACVRVDEKKIPGATLRLTVKNALDQLAGSDPSIGGESVGRKRIPKKIRDAMRDRIRNELIENTCPNTKLFGVLWNIGTGEIWFESTSKSAFDAFEELFVRTFNAPLLPVNPGTMPLLGTVRTPCTTPYVDTLLNLTPTNLIEVPHV
jgi:hypothetical protein